MRIFGRPATWFLLLVQELSQPGAEANLNREGTQGCVPAEEVKTTTDIVSTDDALEGTIRSIALKVFASLPKPSVVEFTDLLQAGNVGLLQARRSYNPALGVPLAAFAKYRIRGEMLSAVHRSSPLGTQVRGENVAWPVRTVPVEGWKEERALEREDWVPERRLVRSQHRRFLSDELGRLPVRYRMVLELKYAEDFTLRQIGTLMRVKESRACQIHRSALAHLRRALHRRGMRSEA